jgi:hypothetical protein
MKTIFCFLVVLLSITFLSLMIKESSGQEAKKDALSVPYPISQDSVWTPSNNDVWSEMEDKC